MARVREPYRVAPFAGGGQVAGTVEFRGAAPPDSAVAVPPEVGACGAGTLRVPALLHAGTRLGEVVVWLSDVRSGKPLPAERRFALTNQDCAFRPRVQAAIVGGMLNVKSGDATHHRTRFVLAGGGTTLGTVEQTDAGQVVPVARVLERAGRVDVMSDEHAWMRGWIFVFDHPYFAVTEADGRFALDSVPAGRHRLIAWHPRLGMRDTAIVVPPDGDVRLTIVFEARP